MSVVAARTRGLYAISRETTDTAALLAWAEAVLAGGAIWLQYRDKSPQTNRRVQQAKALLSLCRHFDACLIVNDDVALAQACAADGVHLGESDVSVVAARKALPADACIGASCYNDLTRAHAAAAAGASYLAFGAFHFSTSKPQARRAEMAVLGQARALDLPLVAIGGITPDNGGALIDAGADLLAVLGGLAGTPEYAHAAARRYAALFVTSPVRPSEP